MLDEAGVERPQGVFYSAVAPAPWRLTVLHRPAIVLHLGDCEHKFIPYPPCSLAGGPGHCLGIERYTTALVSAAPHQRL